MSNGIKPKYITLLMLLLVAAAAIGWAIYTVGSAPLVRRYGAIPLTATTLWIGTAGLLVVAAPALAQSYPNKPIRILVGYAPGGSADAGIRPLAKALETFQSRRWERCRMVVENSLRLGEIEMTGGSKEEHAQIMRDSMMALAQPI